jgi:peptidoglycan DL-endopeptidase CwlO
MSSPSPLRPRSRLATAIAAVLLLAAVAALSAPATAGADSISSARRQAGAAEAHLNELYAQEDAAVNAYDAAKARLDRVQSQIRANKLRLKAAKRTLNAARAQLSALVVSAYKAGDPDATMYLLASRSFTNLVDRVDAMNRTSKSQTALLLQVAAAERRVERERTILRAEKVRADHLVKKTGAAAAHVRSLVAGQQTLIQNLNAHVRKLIAQRKARLAAEARARAAAAAAAAAAASSQPTAPNPAPVAPPSSGPIPPGNSVGEQAVQIAMGELGVPYVWGGASPSGFDCSGLTMWVYAQLGIYLGHFTGSQWNAGPHVPRDQLAPGDLVFFEPGIGHVGIYIGGNQFIHAPHTGTVVQISSLSDAWYAAEYQGAVRVTG